MAKKKRRARKSAVAKRASPADPSAVDTLAADRRSGEVITLAWTLATLTALGATLAAGAVELARSLLFDSEPMFALARLLLAGGALSGILSLLAFPLVMSWSKRRPPTSILTSGMVVAIVPVVIAAWLLQS